MAVAMFVRSPELRRSEYDRLVARLDLDANPPVGQLLHLAVEREELVECVEVWRTAASALAYLETRLGPRLEGLGAGAPEVDLVPLHNLFAPDVDAIGLLGGVSLPARVAGAALS